MTQDARAALNEIGVGDFNATLVIPIMFMGPAQTDPGMTQVQVLLKAMQTTMQRMGADHLVATGRLDRATASCLQAIVGHDWLERPWFEIVDGLIVAKRAGQRFRRTYGDVDGSAPVELSGLGLLPNLPDVPGGIVTVAIGAFLLYRHFKKGK